MWLAHVTVEIYVWHTLVSYFSIFISRHVLRTPFLCYQSKTWVLAQEGDVEEEEEEGEEHGPEIQR